MSLVLGTLAVAVLAATMAVAATLDVAIEPYQRAAKAGQVGGVLGRAVEDPQHPGDPSQPVGDVGVTLLPRSEELLRRFAEIKRRAREAEKDYRTSAPALVAARRTAERALTAAGVGELVRYVVAGPDGQFEVGQLPAGEWLLIAERRRLVAKGSSAPNKRDLEIFARMPRFTGYWVVTVWLRGLAVAAGATEMVELTDRNVWMTAIEERRSSTGP